jgi:hypothetical protein
VFNGTQDVLTPPAHSEIIVQGIPVPSMCSSAMPGHVIMLEHPDLLNEQILALLDRAEQSRAKHLDPAEKPHGHDSSSRPWARRAGSARAFARPVAAERADACREPAR